MTSRQYMEGRGEGGGEVRGGMSETPVDNVSYGGAVLLYSRLGLRTSCWVKNPCKKKQDAAKYDFFPPTYVLPQEVPTVHVRKCAVAEC